MGKFTKNTYMKNYYKSVSALFVFIILIFGCGKLKNLTESVSGNKLYFCEEYDSSTDNCKGESNKYTEGNLTVMVDLRPTKTKLGVRSVNINVTDISTGNVVETFPFDTDSDMDYIYFENVKFENPGKYKVSALKPDGTVIVSNEIEIIDK
ncbi:MAG TPA: hypothetical protein DCY06_08570 [Bacteroidetes bacterium]|nr:hypothetical protein [Bacteroidota bacterium]